MGKLWAGNYDCKYYLSVKKKKDLKPIRMIAT